MDDEVKDSIVDEWNQSENEESWSAESVPMTMLNSSIQIGSASHQKESSHYACHHRYFRQILFNAKYCLSADGLEVKVIGEPSEDEQDWPRYGGDAKKYELRKVLCAVADPAFGEGRLMAQPLRDVVDERKCGD